MPDPATRPTSSSRTVLLLYPRFQPDMPDDRSLTGLPLSVLTVAGPLHRAGYDVRIIDQNVVERPIDRMRGIPRPLYVGISCLGGRQIAEGKALARQASRVWPGVPLVWGGWNPTLMPDHYEHPSSAPYVDIIVRGHGEEQAVELARFFSDPGSSEADLEGIVGITYRDARGVIHRTPDRPQRDLRKETRLPYELIDDLEAYYTRHKVINYHSSYGCPHRCGFCGIPTYTRAFRSIPIERVVTELEQIRALGMRSVIFYDDNFFTSKKRVLDLAREMIDRELGLEWHCNSRLDQIVVCDEDELALLDRAGCRSINVGLETGDQGVSDGIQKDIEIADTRVVAERFHAVGLKLSLNVIIGLPGETPEALVRSFDFLCEIHTHNPEIEVCWYLFMPAPKSPLWNRLQEEGLLYRPETLRDLERLQIVGLERPWYFVSPPRSVLREWRAKHKAIAWYFYHAYASPHPRRRVFVPAFLLRRRLCRFRYERRLFRLRFDWLLFYLAFNLGQRSLWLWRGLMRRWPLALFLRRTRRTGRSVGVPIPGVDVPPMHHAPT